MIAGDSFWRTTRKPKPDREEEMFASERPGPSILPTPGIANRPGGSPRPELERATAHRSRRPSSTRHEKRPTAGTVSHHWFPIEREDLVLNGRNMIRKDADANSPRNGTPPIRHTFVAGLDRLRVSLVGGSVRREPFSPGAMWGESTWVSLGECMKSAVLVPPQGTPLLIVLATVSSERDNACGARYSPLMVPPAPDSGPRL